MSATTRRAPSGLEIPGLDGVRLLAAVSVVFIHASLFAEPLRHGGAPGSWLVRSAFLAVDVLFVVSGFAQFLPMAAAGPEQLPPWRGYAVRRVARIVPVYWAACIATAVYVGHYSWGLGVVGKSVGLGEFLIHISFLNELVFGASGRNGFGPNQAMWTMTIEAIFYVCLPLVARRFLRHPFVGLLAAAAVAGGWRWLAFAIGGPSGVNNVVIQAPAFAFHFAIGMAAAMVVTRLRSMEVAPRALRWGALAAFAWAIAAMAAWLRAIDPAHHQFSQTFLADSRWVWNFVFAIPVGVLLTCLPFAPEWVVWPLANRTAKWLGEGTFGTYLFHIPVLLLINRRWAWLGHGPMALWEIGLLATFESLLIGRLCFVLLERPPRRVAKRISSRIEAGLPAFRRGRVVEAAGTLAPVPARATGG